MPNDPQLLEALGRSQLAAGEVNQGIETFKRIVNQQPKNPSAYILLADAQVVAKDFPAAIETQRKALALRPEASQIAAKLAKIYMLAGRPGDAIAEARKLQKSQPDKATGYALEGEVLAAQAKWAEPPRRSRRRCRSSRCPPSPLARTFRCSAPARRRKPRRWRTSG